MKAIRALLLGVAMALSIASANASSEETSTVLHEIQAHCGEDESCISRQMYAVHNLAQYTGDINILNRCLGRSKNYEVVWECVLAAEVVK